MKQTTMANMQWSVAEPGERVRRASVAINVKAGKLTISRGASILAGSPDFVRLLFSPSPASIAIVPTNSADPLGYSINNSVEGQRPDGRTIGAHHQTLSRPFCRMLAAAGYHGTWVVPLAWHPDGMLWGDMEGARQRENKTKEKRAA